MSLKHWRLMFCAAVVIAFALPSASVAVPEADDGPVLTDDGKEWTLLMYWDADNNLEFCTEFAMDAWTSALTDDSEVNLVAYVDILSENGTWVYDIHDGTYEAVQEWEELNSSDPATLGRFLDYGLENYPAEKTLLVIQDHGYSWRGVCLDETDGGGIMLIDGMAQAIRDARDANGGVGVDVLALDACSVATVEIAYELRDTVDWFVASQLVVPYDGLPYQMMVEALVAEPDVSPCDFSSDMVDMYLEYYSSKTLYEHIYPYDQDFIALSAFDMSMMDAFGEAFIGMTEVLEPLVADNRAAVKDAWDYALMGNWANIGGWEYLPDAYSLFGCMMGMDPALDGAIIAFQEAFDAALLNEGNSDRFGELPHGLNIHFPPSLALYDGESWKWLMNFVYHDIGLDLVDSSRWVQCLMEYYFSAPGLQQCVNHVIG
ncbi:MAG: clostripain-related cysteine peptidase [Candidatus Thermoplasmatota archaeon]